MKPLKDAAMAYKIAREWDYCPSPKQIREVNESFPRATSEVLDEFQGMRPDEIVNRILELIDKMPSLAWVNV